MIQPLTDFGIIFTKQSICKDFLVLFYMKSFSLDISCCKEGDIT